MNKRIYLDLSGGGIYILSEKELMRMEIMHTILPNLRELSGCVRRMMDKVYDLQTTGHSTLGDALLTRNATYEQMMDGLRKFKTLINEMIDLESQ